MDEVPLLTFDFLETKKAIGADEIKCQHKDIPKVENILNEQVANDNLVVIAGLIDLSNSNDDDMKGVSH